MASQPTVQVTVPAGALPQRKRRQRRGGQNVQQRHPQQVQVTQATGRQRRRNRRWRRAGRQTVRTGGRGARRIIQRLGLQGPRPNIRQRITTTLGTIGPNAGRTVELEGSFPLNPALAKEKSGQNNLGPLQVLASQYQQWRVRGVPVLFTPLVGSSAVSGTAFRVSLNTQTTPGSNAWSALGARHHLDFSPGQNKRWRLPNKMLSGPRETWWLTNTNEDATQCLGPSIEIHSYGKTTSTYQNSDWTGDLFLVELTATWEFANYNSQPGLAQLEKTQGSGAGVKVHGEEGKPLTVEVPSTHTSFGALNASYTPLNGGTLSETIWQMADTGAALAAAAVPPPWGWLITGGWWFVRKILTNTSNAPASTVGQNNGSIYFHVYPTYTDAQNEKPAIATGTTVATLSGELELTQISTPNVGPTTSAYSRSIAPDPTPVVGDAFTLVGSVTNNATMQNVSFTPFPTFIWPFVVGEPQQAFYHFYITDGTNVFPTQACAAVTASALFQSRTVQLPTAATGLQLKFGAVVIGDVVAGLTSRNSSTFATVSLVRATLGTAANFPVSAPAEGNSDLLRSIVSSSSVNAYPEMRWARYNPPANGTTARSEFSAGNYYLLWNLGTLSNVTTFGNLTYKTTQANFPDLGNLDWTHETTQILGRDNVLGTQALRLIWGVQVGTNRQLDLTRGLYDSSDESESELEISSDTDYDTDTDWENRESGDEVDGFKASFHFSYEKFKDAPTFEIRGGLIAHLESLGFGREQAELRSLRMLPSEVSRYFRATYHDLLIDGVPPVTAKHEAYEKTQKHFGLSRGHAE
ncbi:capsid protein [Qinghai Himalayan marmot astrovirus 1]|uniref:capsid protein n=1 Tax=Qinghai Himalayan marmot astrovirus 1 TaxID=1961665 RepID=UPI00098059DC|nr:capsid protein [Qinghai Himalayan marmot astrovirus 1]AQM49970.1 capsid protein [Qinghai Himalayan marmot astrovirus 1]